MAKSGKYDPPKVIWVWKPWYWSFGRKVMGAMVQRDLGFAWCFGLFEVQVWRTPESETEESAPEESES